MSNKITDRTIFRLDFTLTATVSPSKKAKRVTKRGILSDMKRLRETKFEPLSCPYANWFDTSVSKAGNKWCIEFMFDCEHTDKAQAEILMQAYYVVFSQGIGMLNGTGFFKNEYDFTRGDFEMIRIDMGYLQSDSSTIYFPNTNHE
jgi:hypothetical protein